MGLALDLAVETLPIVAAGVAMLGLAAALLYVNADHTLNRAFALFLVVRGLSNVLVPVVRPLEEAQAFATLGGAIDMLLVFPALHFGLAYRKAEHGARYPGWLPGLLVAGALGTFVVWLVAPATGPVQVGRPVEVIRIGPIMAMTSLAYNGVLAVVGVLLARDAVGAEDPGVRTSSLLLSVGFLAWPIYLGLSELLNGLTGLSARAAGITVQPAARVKPVAMTLFAVFCLAGVATVAYLYRAARTERWLLRPARLVATALFLVMMAALLPYQLLLLDVGTAPSRGSLAWILQGLALMVMPLAGFYALVRHQVFGVDLKVRFAVRQSTLAAVFLAVFFVVSEGAAAAFEDWSGSVYLGIGAAALLLFAIAPLQRLADRVAGAAVPGVRPVDELDRAERLAIYRDQVRFAWADQALSQDERAMLARLRERLGLSAEDAMAVEERVLAR